MYECVAQINTCVHAFLNAEADINTNMAKDISYYLLSKSKNSNNIVTT